ncbi:MAG TPA: 4a-hydroxytetrahydrobiopterin dehydratase [Tepidisphaeraceae bacterium]|nr:4a-hydroxytetrahydrobiopterin dehydratase [Tepidisphaeraceae bacterium]
MPARKTVYPKNPIADELLKKYSKPMKPGSGALSAKDVANRLKGLNGWTAADGRISKTYKFDDYYRTITFVNAVAWLANKEDHHPDLEVGYNQCVVHYSTHSVGGLSENDFICAAKVDALLRL